jgi:hypothetical protein
MPFNGHRTGQGNDDDPLTKLMQPPEDETPEELQARLFAEAEALKRSNAIDEEINRQKQELKKAPKPVRVLLLGASSRFFLFEKINCFVHRSERIRYV